MSNNVVRLSSGDIIQIRTGVLQGIGPAGPTGAVGPIGLTGPAGPQGVPGPMGAVDDFFTKATSVGSPQSVGALSDTLISFGTVSNDDASLVASVTNFALPVGLWAVQASIVFTKPTSASASGHRQISAVYDGNQVDLVAHNSIAGYDTALQCRTMIFCSSAGKILSFKAFHSDTVSLAVYGTATITRIGPGQVGNDGPVGPGGPAGPIGATGPIGPAGTLIANTTTIANIGG